VRNSLDGEAELKLITKLVKGYYSSRISTLEVPSELPRRELAFMFFDRDDVLRHMSFNDPKELRTFLITHAPRHVYYSSAYYALPREKDMDLKGWLGADLVFDIDSDHIPTQCKSEHDRWRCLDCGAMGRGPAPPHCLNCTSRRIDSESFHLCSLCLEAAKAELLKLIEDFLIPDFGFSPSELHIAFSGRRGYHLHVDADVVKELNQYARREIVDYLKAIGLRSESHGFHPSAKELLAPPLLNHPGWRGRIARGIYCFISSADLSTLERILPPSKRGAAREIFESKNSILASLESSKPNWASVLRHGRRFWQELISRSIASQRCEIDERVTTDVRRLIRLPGSIHGDTGLIAKPLTLNDLDSFNPLVDSVAFKEGEVRVYVYNCPELSLMGQSFGPFNNEVASLPTAVAFYLLRSGRAKLAEP